MSSTPSQSTKTSSPYDDLSTPQSQSDYPTYRKPGDLPSSAKHEFTQGCDVTWNDSNDGCDVIAKPLNLHDAFDETSEQEQHDKQQENLSTQPSPKQKSKKKKYDAGMEEEVNELFALVGREEGNTSGRKPRKTYIESSIELNISRRRRQRRERREQLANEGKKHRQQQSRTGGGEQSIITQKRKTSDSKRSPKSNLKKNKKYGQTSSSEKKTQSNLFSFLTLPEESSTQTDTSFSDLLQQMDEEKEDEQAQDDLSSASSSRSPDAAPKCGTTVTTTTVDNSTSSKSSVVHFANSTHGEGSLEVTSSVYHTSSGSRNNHLNDSHFSVDSDTYTSRQITTTHLTEQNSNNHLSPAGTNSISNVHYHNEKTDNTPAVVSGIDYQSNKPDDNLTNSFSDFEFSEEMLAAVDAAVEARTGQGEVSTAKCEQLEIPDGYIDLTATSTPVNVDSELTTTNTTAAVSYNNEFADFPSVDLEEIDRLVAERELEKQAITGPKYLSFTRYKICSVAEDVEKFTKTIGVVLWSKKVEFDNIFFSTINETGSQQDGYIHLRGEWFHSPCEAGDIIHICSLSGHKKTGVETLPLELNTLHHNESSDAESSDDLVMVVHPDCLVTPTQISDAVDCPRKTVLNYRLGSKVMTTKAAIVGQMRHDLFELCLRHFNFSQEFMQHHVPQIIADHTEDLIGCGMYNEREAFKEVSEILPQIQQFASLYLDCRDKTSQSSITKMGSDLESYGVSPPINFIAHSISSTEDSVVSPELGLKGFVDATVEATTTSQKQMQFGDGYKQFTKSHLMGIELKTGHNQNPQQTHSTQLAMYTLMLRARHGSIPESHYDNDRVNAKNMIRDIQGSACGGMLLYLNQQSLRAIHVSPSSAETKSLINQRNNVAIHTKNTAKPRGIKIDYDGNDDSKNGKEDLQKITVMEPTPTSLPERLQSSHTCTRCFSNRECMLHALAENKIFDMNAHRSLHGDMLLKHFTGHLNDKDLEYFIEWDRLIDLEAHESKNEICKMWLRESKDRESSTGKSISCLVFDGSVNDGSMFCDATNEEYDSFIKFYRDQNSVLNTPLTSLNFEVNSWVIVSTDTTSLSSSTNPSSLLSHGEQHSNRPSRDQMNILRTSIIQVDKSSICLRATASDISRIQKLHQLRFRIDKDEYVAGTGILRQNLINLFTIDVLSFPTRSEQAKNNASLPTNEQRMKKRIGWLRESIVHLKPPMFRSFSIEDSTRNMFTPNRIARRRIKGCDIGTLSREYSQLNIDQQTAVAKVMAAKDYTLIQGFPGTGKTSTIVFIVRLLAARGKRVLITSYTHAAVDNLLQKLLECDVGTKDENGNINSDMIRIGDKKSCHVNIHRILASHLACEFDQKECQDKAPKPSPSVRNLRRVLCSSRIVGVTALTVPRTKLMVGQQFDYIICDEAGQVNQPAILGALRFADSFVLVGDHEQLSPLTQSKFARHAGYDVSLMRRLAEAHPSSVAQLTLQYRMHEDICLLANKVVYGGKLRCANQSVQTSKLNLPSFPKGIRGIVSVPLNGLGWLVPALNPNRPVVFIDTDTCACDANLSFKGLEIVDRGTANDGGSIINNFEASLAKIIFNGLEKCGLNLQDAGLICPYRSQLKLLHEDPFLLSCKRAGLEMSTIDRYQGRDKEIIVLSLVRSNAKGRCGRLLEDRRRINVALTRAKRKLIILGSLRTLTNGSSVLEPLLGMIRSKGWVQRLPGSKALNMYSTREEL